MPDPAPQPLSGLPAVQEEVVLRCIRCGLCSYTCPTYRILRTQAHSPRGRVALLRAASLDGAGVGEGWGHRILSCTLCGACSQVCPSGVQVDDLLLRARQELAQRRLLPPGLARLSQTLNTAHNLSGDDNALRLIWAQNLPHPPTGAVRVQAETVYFVGCVGSFFPRSYAIPRAAARLLDAAGVDYALLGGDEWCCGFPLLANGAGDAAHQAIVHNVERVRALGAHQVVLTCPSCYRTWAHDYPAIAGGLMDGLQVRHISELLADLLDQGRLPLHAADGRVTYHDPCDLGRRGGVVDAPRRVLNGIPGLELVEMREARQDALCCGGGGNLETVDPGLVQAVAARRLAQALETGAQTIVSACPQCERTLAQAARRQDARVRVVDLTELVWEFTG